ncbi:MAG: YbjN domain-containing protein [Treponema sp.]|nr:YbjN domain-containing protein [Treponema sp.]
MAENKIEQYLIDLMFTYQEVETNLWYLDDQEHGLQGVAILKADSLVIFRMALMDAPKNGRLECFTRLLELNACDLIHGAYALENDKVILIDTLEYDTMDYSEFRATLDAFSLAVTQHYPVLSKYRE